MPALLVRPPHGTDTRHRYKCCSDDTKVLDKDILCDENNLNPKFYSPDTCLWVTPEENTFQANKSKVKEIYQFDLDGNFIAKYASQSEASRQTNISQGNIGQVLTGNRIQSGGYKWQYQMNLEN